MNEPREDGPQLQKLFTKLEGTPSFRQETPEGADLLAAVKVPDDYHPESLATNGDPVEDNVVPFPQVGGKTCPGCVDGNDGHEPECESQAFPPAEDEGEDLTAHQLVIQGVGQKLHQAGEAAIVILANMADAEFAMGNPRNMPEPILGWYAMTLAYQLCALEFSNHDAEARREHAGQLAAAMKAVGGATDYARGVQDEIAEVMTNRLAVARRLVGPGEFDVTYGGVLPWA